MCGIAGCLYFSGKKKFSLRPLLQLMKHRGPDESSVIEQSDWSIGVNRLAISAPYEQNTQPLWSPDKRFCFVFNGEIYNHKNIKQTLQEKAYCFKTSCDSEVLFYAYLEYGSQAFLKCQGMFACAIFDTLKKKWILVRDPLGIKPLYFQTCQDWFAFSSEIKPLLLLKKASINKKALPSYLQRRFVLGKETLFSNIFRILPGEVMEVFIKGDAKTQRYWTPKAENSSPKNQNERLKQFSSQIRKSVQLSSESEVGMGVLLSGGLDSSLINALSYSFQKDSNQQAEKQCPMDGWFFDNTYDRKERVFAENLSQKLKQKLYKVYPEENDFLLLPKIIKSLEEPLGDSIITPTYQLMKQISQKEKVALSGEGADEIFGGYGHHQIFYLFKKFGFFNFLSLMVKMLPESLLNACFPYPGKFKKSILCQALKPLSQSGLKRYIEASHLFTSEDINNLIPGLLQESSFSESFYPDISSLKDLLLFDIQNWLPNYNLLRIDKLSMAHSLEVRVPYLNLDLAALCMGLPEQDIISLFRSKKILREFAYKQSLLDYKTSYRKKHPFTFKEKNVYGKKYREFTKDHLDESFMKKWNIKTEAINKLLGESNEYLNIQKQITSLLHLSIWTKEFF